MDLFEFMFVGKIFGMRIKGGIVILMCGCFRDGFELVFVVLDYDVMWGGVMFVKIVEFLGFNV